ncbi:MAG: DUF1499 domain-containing protein [Thermodesulfobacteriota bacterium]
MMKTVLPQGLDLLMLPCLLLLMVSCSGKPPEARLVDGRLRPCPQSPNCVSSEEQRPEAQVAPLAFQGPPEAAWQALTEAIREEGGKIQQQEEHYLWTTFTSRLFRFVDDVEFRLVAAENLIHVRSASRLGYADLGVNRKRVEKLRELFKQRLGEQAGPL